jgi:hypothetical protein
METTHSSELKFLGLTITNNLNWKTQIQSLCVSLSKVYYILKSLKGVMSLHIIKTIYLAYFQTRMKYGIVFWGNDCDSIKVFRMQKNVIRLIAVVKKCESCRQILKDFKILTMPSLYFLEVLCFINKNKKNLNNKCHIHNHNTWRKCDLHVQSCNIYTYIHIHIHSPIQYPREYDWIWNMTQYQKNVINMRIRLFNNLPDRIKKVDNQKSFKRAVKQILLHNSFYSIQEYYNFNDF